MGFLEEAKKQGYSEKEAKDFADRVTKARKAGYTDDEIKGFLDENGMIPQAKTPEIRARLPDEGIRTGSIRAPMSPSEEATDIIRRGKPSEFTKELLDAAPEVLGATTMTMAAGPVGIPAAAGLAALGGAGGKGYELAAKELTGAPGAPTTSGEALKEVTGAATRQLVAEGAGRAVIKAIGRVLRGGFFEPAPNLSGKRVTEVLSDKVANKEALLAGKKPKITKEDLLKTPDINAKDLFESFGGNYTASQMSNSRTLDVLDNMAQGSFIGGGTMDTVYHSQQKTVKDISDTIADNLMREGQEKLSDRQLGQMFVDTVQDGRKAFNTAAEKVFRNVDDIIYQGMQQANPEEVNPFLFPGKTGTTVATPPSVMGNEGLPDIIPTKRPSESGYVNVKPLIDRAKEIISDYGRVRNIGKSDAGGKLFDSIAALPETMTFGDAQLLRSVLLDDVRSLRKSGGGRELRYASEFAGLADGQMEKAAKNLSGEALKAWRDANKFWKFGVTNFDNKFIKGLIDNQKTNWSEVGDLIFRSGDDDAVRTARKTLRAAEFTSKKNSEGPQIDFNKTWRQMQAGYYDSLIRKNTTPEGDFNARGLLADLNNRKTERTIKAAFNNDQLNAVKNFARAASLAESKNATKTGSMVIQFAQGGALLSLMNPDEIFGDISGTIRKVAGGVILGPYVIAKLLTNPMTTRWLIQGVKTPITTGASGGLAARLGYSALKAQQDSSLPAEDEIK